MPGFKCLATVHVGVCNLKHGMSCINTLNIFQTSHYQYITHKHQPSSHFVFTCNVMFLAHHSHGLHAVTHLLGPHAVPIHHGSAVLFHRSMQRAHQVLLLWDTSMSFNPQSQTPNTTVPNFVPMLHSVYNISHGSGETEKSR